uniref:Uncharacterized protein n=1 Tax=Romanomermis culicivorax TaxID=13658 RepID=A0A915IE62_ROMCU
MQCQKPDMYAVALVGPPFNRGVLRILEQAFREKQTIQRHHAAPLFSMNRTIGAARCRAFIPTNATNRSLLLEEYTIFKSWSITHVFFDFVFADSEPNTGQPMSNEQISAQKQ